MKVERLYPQFNNLTERRKRNDTVSFERRSGVDRRDSLRLDSKTQADISELQETFKAFDPKIDYFLNQTEKFYALTKFTSNETKQILKTLSPIAPIRRISSIPENIKDGNYEKAIGLTGLAIVNFPEDTRDLKSAYKHIFEGKVPDYDFVNYQHPFSFIRGTVLEKYVNKMGNVGAKLHELDKTLLDTKAGQFLQNKILKCELADTKNTGRKVDQLIRESSGKIIMQEVKVKAFKYSDNFVKNFYCRVLNRIPVLSVIALSLLEIPNIIKAFDNNPQSGIKQIAKSAVNLCCMFTGIGIIGATLSMAGPAGSLVGIGVGSVIGLNIASKINASIDKLGVETT